jgi:hypothetical protein
MRAAKLTPLRDPAEVPLERLEEHPRYKAAHAELVALERRFAEAEQRERVALARRRGQRPTTSTAERVKSLLAGGSVMSASPQGELEAAEEEQHVLRSAIFSAREKLDAIAGEISREVGARFSAMNGEALRAALEAAAQLHIALHANRVLRGRLIGAGYSVNESVLPTHFFPAGAAVGDPAAPGMSSPASVFRQWLIEREII